MNNPIMQFQNFMQNPAQYLQKMGVPQNVNTPQGAIQYLMDSGKLSQADFNRFQQQAQQIQKNPAFQQMFMRNK